jgi:hypothetical protein
MAENGCRGIGADPAFEPIDYCREISDAPQPPVLITARPSLLRGRCSDTNRAAFCSAPCDAGLSTRHRSVNFEGIFGVSFESVFVGARVKAPMRGANFRSHGC